MTSRRTSDLRHARAHVSFFTQDSLAVVHPLRYVYTHPSALICIYGHLCTYISVSAYICPYTMLQTDSHLPLEISFRLILVTRIDKMLAFVIKSPFFFSFHFFKKPGFPLMKNIGYSKRHAIFVHKGIYIAT